MKQVYRIIYNKYDIPRKVYKYPYKGIEEYIFNKLVTAFNNDTIGSIVGLFKGATGNVLIHKFHQ